MPKPARGRKQIWHGPCVPEPLVSTDEKTPKPPPPAKDPSIRKGPQGDPPEKKPVRRDPKVDPSDPNRPDSIEDPRAPGQPRRIQT